MKHCPKTPTVLNTRSMGHPMLRSTKSTSISSLITSQARATRSGLAPQIYLNHVQLDQQKNAWIT